MSKVGQFVTVSYMVMAMIKFVGSTSRAPALKLTKVIVKFASLELGGPALELTGW